MTGTQDIALAHDLMGPEGAPAVVLLGTLGTDAALWQPLLPHLPGTLRYLSVDLRGHGASPCPPGPYRMGALVGDVERLLDGLGVRDTLLVGCGLGGMIAQGLAVKRLDLVRGLVLINSAARLGQPERLAHREVDAHARARVDEPQHGLAQVRKLLDVDPPLVARLARRHEHAVQVHDEAALRVVRQRDAAAPVLAADGLKDERQVEVGALRVQPGDR